MLGEVNLTGFDELRALGTSLETLSAKPEEVVSETQVIKLVRSLYHIAYIFTSV